MHVAMDALIMVISYALAYFIKFYILDADTVGVGVLPPKDYFVVLFFIVPGYLFLYFFCNVYWGCLRYYGFANPRGQSLSLYSFISLTCKYNLT